MRYLLINADDFGFSPGVTAGILKAMTEGVVTRTSVMMCRGNLEEVKRQALLISGRSGIHLQLTTGKPLSCVDEVKTLVNDSGEFPLYKKELPDKNLKQEEIYLEWDKQIQAFINWGIQPSHLDTHHNVHQFPVIFDVFVELAKKYALPVRPLTLEMKDRFRLSGLQCTDVSYANWEGEHLTAENFVTHMLGAFRRINNNGTLEFVCHPGYTDEILNENSVYVQQRELELRILCSKELKELLSRYDIQILNKEPINYA